LLTQRQGIKVVIRHGVTLWFKFNNLESGKTKLMIPFVGVFVN